MASTPDSFSVTQYSKAILVVAAETETRTVLRIWLEKRGFTVHEAGDLETAMRSIFRWANLSAVICDHKLSDGGALNFLHWMREQLFSIPFLLITGRPEAGLKRGRGFEVIKIPITGTALREALGRLIDVDLIEVGPQPDSTIIGRQRRGLKRKRQRKSKVA